MGLEYGFDENTGKWYAKGLQFTRLYNSESEMEADKMNALKDYFERRVNYVSFMCALADLSIFKVKE